MTYHHRFAPVMWGTIATTLMVLAIGGVYGLGPRMAGYAVGIMVVVCLAVCGPAFWLDTRAWRRTTRAVASPHGRSSH